MVVVESSQVLPDDARAACGTDGSIFGAIASIPSIASIVLATESTSQHGLCAETRLIGQVTMCQYEKRCQMSKNIKIFRNEFCLWVPFWQNITELFWKRQISFSTNLLKGIFVSFMECIVFFLHIFALGCGVFWSVQPFGCFQGTVTAVGKKRGLRKRLETICANEGSSRKAIADGPNP